MYKLTKVSKGVKAGMTRELVFTDGDWDGPWAEGYADGRGLPVTHLHVYDRARAAEAWQAGELKLPPTVRTVSYGY
jgi:hypothetical protein